MKKLAPLAALVAALAVGIGLAPGASAGPPGPTLLDVAVAANTSGAYAGEFDTLIAAVLAADPAVAATLAGKGQRTVFAPTDAAFTKLGLNAENVGTLPQSTLTDILRYHVVNGRRDSGSIVGASRIRTIGGGFLWQSGGVLTDAQGRDATIVVTDVPAANGIIHAIDAVLLP
jgi:uncharacterized surface protein with fasciclin (FAS1) repeats